MNIRLSNNLTYSREVVRDFNSDEFKNRISNAYSFVVVHGENPTVGDDWQKEVKNSAVIPILKNEEEQMAVYQATCRNQIRRSYKIEEFTIEYNSTPIDELFQFHKMCEKLRGWIPVPPEELEASQVICVRYKDELIVGMSAYGSNGILRIGRIFSLRKSEKYKDLQQVVFSAASRRVIHEFTLLARSLGFQSLDLGGIVIDGDAQKSGITKFKMSFGSVVKPIYLLRLEGEDYTQLENSFNENNFDLT